MRKMLYFLVLIPLMLAGCGSANTGGTLATGGSPGDANVFNPYMREKLPNIRQMTNEGHQMLNSMGAGIQSIEGEAAHRKNWREEIYPVVFGERTAPHEIIVLLNFAEPESAEAWQAVVEASRSLTPAQCKIAVFDRSSENYGTDLMGLAIWIAHSRPGQAMPYLTYALEQWNRVKAEQKKQGKLKAFTNEYDATASAQEKPIHYNYFSMLKPPIPQSQETAVARYCYNAGSVNKYQANQICQYYGINSLPAVIVDGRELKKITSSAILDALK